MPSATTELQEASALLLPVNDIRVMLTVAAQLLVDHPDEIRVQTIQKPSGVLYTINACARDVGVLIGRHGRNARSLRILAHGIGIKYGAMVEIEIDEPRRH